MTVVDDTEELSPNFQSAALVAALYATMRPSDVHAAYW